MGLTLLGDVLSSWEKCELDDSVYVPVGAILAVDLLVSVLPADPDGGRSFEEQEYFLGLEQIRDVVEGLEAQLGRKAKQTERLRAAVHYARHDAFIDPREASFLDRARALGMRFIVFQDGALGFYLELQGKDLRTAVRCTEIDANQFSRRARDLAGVAAFDRLRNDIASRYGLDASRCRLAALVPIVIDHAFRGEESAALATLGRPADEVLALCGALTGDASRPLRITHALTADNIWVELKS